MARLDRSHEVGENVGSSELRRMFCQVLLLFTGLLALPALAAKWDIVTDLSVEEMYTDNLRLAPNSTKESEWITQLRPSIAIRADGPGLRFMANYSPQLVYYAQSNADTKVFHDGAASLNAELIDQRLFVDAGARVSYANVSVQGPVTESNVNPTGNRARVETFFVSPVLVQNFGSAARAEARFTFSAANSNDPGSTQDSTANAVNLLLASGPAYRVLTGDISYFKQRIDYDDPLTSSVDSDVILANARQLIRPTVGLLVQGGYEEYDYGAAGLASDNGSRWAVGLDWLPSPRTRLAALAGRRFFGDAYQLDFRHRTRRTTLSASYTEDVTTTRSNYFAPTANTTAGYLDPLHCAQASDQVACKREVGSVISQRGLPITLGGPINSFTNRPLLEKRWLAAIAVEGVRNIVIANVFTLDRTPLPGAVFLPGPSTVEESSDEIGTSLAWNLRMSARDTWNLGAAYTRRKFPGREDDLTSVSMGLTRQFQPRFSGSLSYRRLQNDSNLSTSEYTENAVIGTVQIRF